MQTQRDICDARSTDLYTRLQMVYSATEYTQFVKALSTFRLSYGFKVHAWMSFHFHPQEKYKFPVEQFNKTKQESHLMQMLLWISRK